MFKLNAEKRDQKSTKVRAAGKVPAVVYGAGLQTESISLSLKEFIKVYQEAGGASLVDLVLDGKDFGKVLIYEVAHEPVKDQIIHVDLKKVDMNKLIVATVKLNFLGEAPAVKELGGTLVQNIEEIEIECLPKDLVSYLDVDLTSLKTFDDTFKISDLVLPVDIKIADHKEDQIIAKVLAPITEEQFKAMEESSTETDLSKIESVNKKEESTDEKTDEDAGDKK